QAGTNDLKTVICLTDGRDETPGGKSPFSSKKPEELIEFARRARVRLITVGLGNGIDTNLLQSCATRTNGWYLHVPSPGQLAKAYQELSRKMTMERVYHFRYTTPEAKPDGTRRDLTVNSKAKGEKDQGKGYYIAPTVEQLKSLQERAAGSTGTSGGKTNVKLNPPDLGKPGSVGRLGPADLGTTGQVGHIGSQSVGSLGQIGSLGPGLEHVETEVNQMFKQLDQQNQQHLDNGINQGNQAIDTANESNAAIDAANQQQLDQTISDTNTSLEQTDQTNQDAAQDAQDAVNQSYDQMNQQMQDAMPDVPSMPDMPDTSGDD
ncbi:MAG TPA: VWA domain-containing protein, partial [Candidatus Ozemobacteraceae bacterium]|nr:VWA domain-containing protein [Candidatus Ozemobacteraceae bacterium]